jgi:large subunit ribosomal protein L17
MRHRKSTKKLGLSTKAHRKALLSNLAMELIRHKRIQTTHTRAKELRRFIEPLITLAKRGDLHARRLVLRKIKHKEIVHSLFHEIAPVYATRPGGYTRITKLGFRDNDRAAMSVIELVDLVGTGGSGSKEAQGKETKKAKGSKSEA